MHCTKFPCCFKNVPWEQVRRVECDTQCVKYSDLLLQAKKFTCNVSVVAVCIRVYIIMVDIYWVYIFIMVEDTRSSVIFII